ncbi:MAG: serine/threonine protein kinase [Deltaproteobacteria bacterium]|nr:MAG: serine/threonine protein kinase [Deltaproteobacteria bacterium]TMQ25318.1 MAG: serine/threonine protein kinase [Deltaproteobacteria bacterium]
MMQVLDIGFSADDRIGNYRVERELGPTGSGVLLQVRHQVLPRRAIIKVVHAAFAAMPPFVVQTLREACILEAIGHPGVPIVYESGLLRDRRPWFAFEMIHGPTLEDILASGTMPVLEVAGALRDLAEILEHAHRHGVIHRGLRPDRIVVTHDRRYPLCIPDWSEAIAHDASACVPPPDGCYGYVAPELAHQDAGGAERVDDRADMFALGAIAYRALTGALPFEPGAAYIPVHRRHPGVPRELATIIDSLLSFDRFDRPSSSEVRAEMDWLLPALQQRAAAADCSASENVADSRENVVLLEQPRMRRPRWTPNVHYVETTDVDILLPDDELSPY